MDMLFHNYKVVKKNTLTESELETVNNLYDICNKYDEYEYFFYTAEEDELSDLGQNSIQYYVYYLCYDKDILTGAITVCEDALSPCIYTIIHPDYRRQHIFSSLLHSLSNDLHASNVPFAEIHLPDSICIPNYIFSILSDNHFILNHHEYIMEYNFSDFQNSCSLGNHPAENLFNIASNDIKTYDDKYNDKYDHFKNEDDLEIEFDDIENEFSIWLNDEYIGIGKIYPFYSDPRNNSDAKNTFSNTLKNNSDDSNTFLAPCGSDEAYTSIQDSLADCDYVTFYGYEILEEYRGKGYGKHGFALILDLLHEMHCKKLLLHVSGENEKAHSIYVGCGLKVQSSFSVYKLKL